MTLDDRELQQIARSTLSHYSQRADDFWRGTRDHDVQQNIDALLQAIEGQAPFQIMDLGCGPGRDLKAFVDRGHIAVGVEGSEPFVKMAREFSGCEVWLQDFLQLDLPAERFDGVFANASLFHIPRQALPQVLGKLRESLKPGGVLFASNPRGNNEEGWNGQRYAVYHDLQAWRAFLTAAGFSELSHYYRPPGLPREQQGWLASVWKR